MIAHVVEYDVASYDYKAKFRCRQCDNPVDQFDKFCRNCGRKLEPIGFPFHFTKGEICAILYMAANDGILARLEGLRPGIGDHDDADPFRCVHFFDKSKLEKKK
jgi:hypothetical protein